MAERGSDTVTPLLWGMTYSAKLHVTCVKREMMANQGDMEIIELLLQAEDDVKWNFSGKLLEK